jgi:hypothetical protein
MYEFKLIPEAVRAAGFAALVFGLQLLVEFNIDEVILDWQTYMKAGASGLIAAAAAGALAVFTRRS